MVDTRPPLRVAVVGVGHFGSYHCEKIKVIPEASLEAVVDVDFDHAKAVAERFDTRALNSLAALSDVADAAIVAVPSNKHHLVASHLLSSGMDVLVEKPLATSLDDARALCEIAKSTKSMIQVGHLERFNPILEQALVKVHGPRFVRMDRLGPFPGRGVDVNTVYELMIHDLDIVLQLAKAKPIKVWSKGWKVVTHHHDIVWARLEFAGGMMAELNASRVSSKQLRGFSVLDSVGMLEVDLAGRSMNRITFEDGIQNSKRKKLKGADPLLEQDRAFVLSAMNGRKPMVSGQAAIGAVELAEMIVSSLEDETE